MPPLYVRSTNLSTGKREDAISISTFERTTIRWTASVSWPKCRARFMQLVPVGIFGPLKMSSTVSFAYIYRPIQISQFKFPISSSVLIPNKSEWMQISKLLRICCRIDFCTVFVDSCISKNSYANASVLYWINSFVHVHIQMCIYSWGEHPSFWYSCKLALEAIILWSRRNHIPSWKLTTVDLTVFRLYSVFFKNLFSVCKLPTYRTQCC